ncbi:hypothetical protein ACLMJK_008135 [Lecanora helva]
MAEAAAAIGLVVNIVQLVEWGRKIVRRLDEFQRKADEVPKTFLDIKTELPLLLNTLDETQEQAKAGLITEDTQKVLLPVVEGCRAQVEQLDEILVKTLPVATDHRWERGVKALSSLHQEKKVKSISETLRGFIQVLTYHQATRLGRLDLGDYLHTARSRSPRPESRKLFLVPFDRDYGYIDRAGIIGELDEWLKRQKRVSLAGIGGVGKSQIAIEYCYRYHEKNPAANVFWVHASTLPQIDQSYRQIARKLSLPDWDDLSPNTFQILCDWLSDPEHGPWLMVLDSADDIDLFFQKPSKGAKPAQQSQISQFIPRSSVGSIIITTRDRRVAERLADRQKPIAVSPMSNAEAEELLRSKLAQELRPEAAPLVELVDTLGSLPLAISQAAAFMTENSMEAGDYLDAFKSDAAEFLSEDLGDHRRHPDSENSILTTWKLSFEQIAQKQPRAAEILSLMSVLDRNSISKSLLIRDGERSLDFTLALGTLQAFSLIMPEKDGKFALHRLVQLSTQRWLENEGTETQWQEKALMALVKHFPPGDFDNWRTCEALSPHAQIVIGYDFKYVLAHNRYREVIPIRKNFLGSEDVQTLQSICYFGEVLFRESKYPEAEAVLRESLAGRERILGPNHPDTIMNIGHLAEVVRGLKRYREAEELYQRTLAGKEDDLGNDHVAMKNADNLGSVLRDAGRLEEAERWVRLALEAREKVTGSNSPETLGSVSHLALILRLRGRYDEAEIQNKRALAGFERELGREHHYTLRSLDDLAVVFRCQGKLEAAEEQNRRALRGLSNAFGPRFRRTLASTRNLAIILEMQGRKVESAELLKRLLKAKQEEHGIDSPEALAIQSEIEQVLAEKSESLEAKTEHLTVGSSR